MTEPSPSHMPSPTAPSDHSWTGWFGPLDSLWTNHPFVAFVLGLLIAAALSGLGWMSRWVWKNWRQREDDKEAASRKQLLPPRIPPFTVDVGVHRLNLEPAQPQLESAPNFPDICRLLQADSTPVPFLDRSGTLARLETWARNKTPFAIHVLGGDGGSGKTRLGVELCRSLTAASTPGRGTETWKAGFLKEISQLEDIVSSTDTSSLLLVVDYAESRPDVVEDILDAAHRAAMEHERKRVRLIFLVRRPSPLPATRQGGNKWVDALRPQDYHNEGLNRLLDGASTIVLNDEELSSTERRELFTQAYASFVESPDSNLSDNLLDQLNNPIYAQPLLVTINALLNARSLPGTQRTCSPDKLFEEVLYHEEKYWKKHWSAATPFNRELARQAVSAATLADIQDEDDATSLIALLPASSVENTKDLAQWLRHCYPPPIKEDGSSAMWCGHLEPDRIGEHLVASESANLSSLLCELLSPSRVGGSPLRTLTVLERAATDPYVKEHVGRILNDMLVEVTQAIESQAISTQTPDLSTGFANLVSAVCSHIEPDKAHEAEQTLSEGGHLTAFLAYELARQASNIDTPTTDTPDTIQDNYAFRKAMLSNRLDDIGKLQEALEAAKEAARVYRHLAKVKPDSYKLSLASSLNNLSNLLRKVGRRDEILAIIREAVEIHRHLADHTPNLATSLQNLAIHLSDIGRQEEALDTIRESVIIRRDLAQQNTVTRNQGLASSLNTLAAILGNMDQIDEALINIQESVTIRRDLAQQNAAAYSPDLAMSLNNLAQYLTRSGNPDEALAAIQEATDTYRYLTHEQPATYSPDLAKSLHNLSVLLAETNHQEEALSTLKESSEIYRSLARKYPLAYNTKLAESLELFAIRLSEGNQQDKALSISTESLSLYRRLAQDCLDAHISDLANSLNSHAIHLGENGRKDEALTTSKKAVNFYRDLSTHNPGSYDLRLANALYNLAVHFSESGLKNEAIDAATESVTLYRHLADQNPANYKHSLADSLDSLSTYLSESGRHDDALEAREETTDLYRDLASKDPQSFSSKFAATLEIYADILHQSGNIEKAAHILQERHETLKQVKEMEEGNA